MITSAELEKTPLFAGVEEQERRRLARRAADISLEPGEWLIREGEEPRFFVVLEGELEAIKDIVGQRRMLGRSGAGDFSGETPIFMGTASIVSVRAVTKCRVARFERQQLQELVRDSPSAGEMIFQTMTSRFGMAQKLARESPSSRVHLSGSKYDNNCRAIRAFLSANRIQYDWRLSGTEPETDVTVSVEGTPLENPTVRRVAEALGFQTVPKHLHYDIIIAGAGPAGLAAAVYSASEGLKVLLVERFAAGGQAGTSSRIENYLGFPAGISGDELTERALKQAKHFAVEMLFKRNVEQVQSLDDGHCVTLDGGDRITARVLLLATGVSWNRLEFEGHDELLGRGIVYGASRFDGVAVIGHCIFIVGGGNSAGQAAVFYSGYAAQVIMLVRGAGLTQTMSQYLIQQIHDKANIRVEPYTQVTAVHGDDHLEQITTSSRPPGGPESTCTRDAKALFIMIGAVAKTQWLPTSLERDANGYICTGRDMTTWSLDREPFALETSIPGVFCAGDVRHGSVKRVASGVGEGSMAIAFIHEYLALPDAHSQGSVSPFHRAV
jgi:thioredoxin reductase (NADPH)